MKKVQIYDQTVELSANCTLSSDERNKDVGRFIRISCCVLRDTSEEYCCVARLYLYFRRFTLVERSKIKISRQ